MPPSSSNALERRTLLTAAAFLLAGAAALQFALPHLAPHKARLAYALQHLPAALAAIGLACALTAAIFVRLHPRAGWRQALEQLSAARLGALVTACFAVFWVPAWWAGGLVADDWRLLAAASIRRVIYGHPALLFSTLDSVDGNFRPLGTVVYFGAVFKTFGPNAARAYTLGPLVFLLLTTLLAFWIVRELGYANLTACAAALLFLSRGMLYTVVTWASALGDGLALFFCAAAALLLLKALRRRGATSCSLHALAWFVFLPATLSKQSSFVFPLIAALVLLLRPGRCLPAPPVRRALTALAAAAAYIAPCAAAFLRGNYLYHWPSPYPLAYSNAALLRTFAYLTWYLGVLEFPNRLRAWNVLPDLLGFLLALAAILLVRRHRSLLGPRAGDVLFTAAAALASLSLFVLLQTRAAPYYGGMAAFWISIGLAIVLTGGAAPRAEANDNHVSYAPAASRVLAAIFVALVLTGFGEVRLEQTGLLPTGGYFWGTFGPEVDRSFRDYIDRKLTADPAAHTVLFDQCLDLTAYPAMALTDGPDIDRILVLTPPGVPVGPRPDTYYGNDLQGLRPQDTAAALTDSASYAWTIPLIPAQAQAILHAGPTVVIPCREGFLAP